MLEQILEKLGVTSPDQLKPAEKATWLAWSTILAKRDVSIDDLKTLLPAEIERAKVELLKYDNSKEKDIYHKAYISVLETITKIITGPTQERDRLKAALRQQYGIE